MKPELCIDSKKESLSLKASINLTESVKNSNMQRQSVAYIQTQKDNLQNKTISN